MLFNADHVTFMDIKEIGSTGMDWIHLAQDRQLAGSRGYDNKI